ncbi:MAG: hypothetical protein JWL86_4426 [Rhizobium sp.]|nr:hypothetical protein [Rhizobium sp.]
MLMTALLVTLKRFPVAPVPENVMLVASSSELPEASTKADERAGVPDVVIVRPAMFNIGEFAEN